MQTIDIMLKRSSKINTGNFNNCEPVVMLTVKDVPLDKYQETYELLAELADNTMALETKCVLNESIAARLDAEAYVKGIEENEDNIRVSSLKTARKLAKIGGKVEII